MFLNLSYGPNIKIWWPMEYFGINSDQMKFKGKSQQKLDFRALIMKEWDLDAKIFFKGRNKWEK